MHTDPISPPKSPGKGPLNASNASMPVSQRPETRRSPFLGDILLIGDRLSLHYKTDLTLRETIFAPASFKQLFPALIGSQVYRVDGLCRERLTFLFPVIHHL